MIKNTKNPIKRIRTLEHLSLQQFADKIGVSVPALYLNEVGVYPHVLPKIMEHIVELGYTRSEIQKEYEEWVSSTRKERAKDYQLPAPDFQWHPVAQLRKALQLSKIGFAKQFLVQPALLHSLESGKLRSLPSQLHTALLESGFSQSQVTELDYRCREYDPSDYVDPVDTAA